MYYYSSTYRKNWRVATVACGPLRHALRAGVRVHAGCGVAAGRALTVMGYLIHFFIFFLPTPPNLLGSNFGPTPNTTHTRAEPIRVV